MAQVTRARFIELALQLLSLQDTDLVQSVLAIKSLWPALLRDINTDTVEVAERVLAHTVNKELCDALRAAGASPAPLHSLGCNVLAAELQECKPGKELGLVGHITDVRTDVIAGLCQLVVVVEAAERSGSLITARCAAEAGRDVAAVPGSPLSPLSAGTNSLLKDGAILVRNAADVLAELPQTALASASRSRESRCSSRLVSAIG